MLSATALVTRPDFSVTAVGCTGAHARWSEPEVRDGHRLVLVRRGRFSRRADGAHTEVDTTLAYLGVPGEEEQFAHPAGGDQCTSITVGPRLWRSMAGDPGRVRVSTPGVYVDARVDLAHRRVLAAARAGDLDHALPEQLLGLLAETVRQTASGPTPMAAHAAHASRTARASRGEAALVAAARDAELDGNPAADGLLPLAELLGVSPYRLSRSFTRELGVSLTRFRNRVRVGRALDRLESGEPELSLLAADLGFADQAHLCRTVRQHLGHTPTALRRLLAS